MTRFRLGLLMALLPLTAALTGSVQAQGAASHTAPVLRGTEVFPRGKFLAHDFALRDQYGRAVSLAALRGRIVAVTFMDSHCTKACPVEGKELAITQRMLGGRLSPLVLLFVGVSPGHDTPASARHFIKKMGIPGQWHWLMGSRNQLAPVWLKYGILVQPVQGDIQHTTALYLIDQAGWMRVADGLPLIPAQLAESVRALATHG